MMKLKIILLMLLFNSFFGVAQKNDELYDSFYDAVFNNRTKKADSILLKIVELEKDDFFFCIKKAEIMMANKDIDSAALYYERAIKIRKQSSSYFYNNDSKESIVDVYKKAIKNYDLIVLSDSANAIHLCNRGILNQEMGFYDDALHDFDRSLSIEKHYLTYFNRAICNTKTGNTKDAIRDYTLCLSLNSDYGSAFLNRGFCFLDIEDYESAKSDFIQSIEYAESPKERGFSLNNLGYVYLMLKDYNKARYNINLSIEFNPLNSYAYRNLGLVEIAENNRTEACDSFQKALDMGFREQYGSEIDDLIIKHNCQ